MAIGNAQTALPDFKVENIGKNRYRITWNNPHGNNCVQINVQRSYDSLKNFRTIFAPISPELPQNGFVDAEGSSPLAYYRIFYVLDQGAYFFTASKHPSINQDTGLNIMPEVKPRITPEVFITVIEKDSVFARFQDFEYRKFRDSINKKTRDTLFYQNAETILLKRFDSSTIWLPSPFVFTNRDGYVNIKLDGAGNKKYRLIVFESSGKKLFSLSHIKESYLTLDKTNFMHSGWYNFELYEDEKLKEKNKFYLPKEF